MEMADNGSTIALKVFFERVDFGNPHISAIHSDFNIPEFVMCELPPSGGIR